MSDGQALAGAASEGVSAPVEQASGGNSAAANANNEEAGGGAAGEGAQESEVSESDLANLGLDPKNPRGLKERFTTLSAEKRAAEAAAAEAESRARELQARLDERRRGSEPESQAPRVAADPNPQPNPDDKAKYPLGRDDPQYIEDRALWRIRTEQAQERAEETRRAAAQAEFNERRETFLRAVEAAKGNQDTPHAAAQLGAMAPAITDLVAVSNHAALIAEHLHNNPDQYKDLAKHIGADGSLSGRGLAEVSRRIGALETSLPGAFASRKVTKAGNPPDTLNGGGGKTHNSTPQHYAASGDSEAYRAWRRANPRG